jgi:hypothetical protein
MSATAQIGRKLAADATTCIRPSGEAFMEPTQPHSNGSLSGPDDARRLRAAIEVLSNLIYLASREAEDPERVRTYLKLAEKQVAALGHTLGKKSAIHAAE